MFETLFAMDPHTIASFVIAGIALNVTPGADVMFTAATAIRGGVWAGVAAAAGISAGSLFHVALTTLGVAALLATYPAAFETIRWAGAAYLLYLAYKSWIAPITDTAQASSTLQSAFVRGMITNILNPKVALFILAFLPSFTDPASGPIAPQMMILGMIFGATGFVITSAYGVAAGHLRSWIATRQKTINKITAGVYGALALRLATQ